MKKLILFIGYLVGVSPVVWGTTLTASDVLSRARVYLRDQSTVSNRQTFPDSTLLQFLSDGQREANAQNWILQSSFSITLIQGTTEYAAPGDYMAALRVWYKTVGSTSFVKLDATSMDQLDSQSAGWTGATGPPTKYYLDRSTSTFYLGFFPAPSVSNSTGTVTVYYVQQTQDCTSTTCTPFNGQLILQPYVSALAYYVAYRGFLSIEETDISNEYLQYWVSFLGIMRQGTYKTPDFNPGFVGQHGSP